MADRRLRTEPVFPLQSQQTTEKTTSMTKDSQPAQKSCYYTLPNGARLAPARVMSFAHDGSGIPYDNESGGDDESNDDEMSSEDENSVTRYLMIRGGKMLLVGDHVAVQGDDENIYYAIVRGLWMSAEGAKIVSLQWLLPRPEHALDIDGPPENILPSFFSLGPVHERLEPAECIVDVFFSSQRAISQELRSADMKFNRHVENYRPKSRCPTLMEEVELAHLLCSMT